MDLGWLTALLAGLLLPRLGTRALFGAAALCFLSGALLMRRAARTISAGRDGSPPPGT